jgi:uncharacterized membrane protein YphA (DoxX/SURF4 family)
MQKILRKFNSNFFLRLGLGTMLLYSGYTTIVQPLSRNNLLVELPPIIKGFISIIPPEALLRFLGLGEIIIALALILWFLPRRIVFFAGIITALEVGFLLFVFGLTPTTYVYLGALAAAIGLTLAYRRGW